MIQNLKNFIPIAGPNFINDTSMLGEPQHNSLPVMTCQSCKDFLNHNSSNFFQMAWQCFLNLLQLIESHPIFYNCSWNQQQDPSVQLAVAICCLGSNGNGAAVFQLKNFFHVGYGTINLYTTWVTKVI
jgi:hypothetical protein